QARQAGDLRRRQARAAAVGRQEAPFEDASDGLTALTTDPGGEESVRKRAVLPRPVEDLPIAELASPTQRHRPRSDSAEREGDLPQALAAEASSPGALRIAHLPSP